MNEFINFDDIYDFLKPSENLTKNTVITIEEKIKDFFTAYETVDFIKLNRLTEEEEAELKNLFYIRQYILNYLFIANEQNLSRLQNISNHLKYLSEKLFSRVKDIANKINLICDDPDFTDDYEIEGTLKFNYNDESSVLKLDDDHYYGSDFSFMLQAISLYYDEKHRYNSIIEITPKRENNDDRHNWNISSLKFPNLNICYAAYCIVEHYDYSIPDLIRMNDFWAEVKFTEQSITDQKGNRFKENNGYNGSNSNNKFTGKNILLKN